MLLLDQRKAQLKYLDEGEDLLPVDWSANPILDQYREFLWHRIYLSRDLPTKNMRDLK